VHKLLTKNEAVKIEMARYIGFYSFFTPGQATIMPVIRLGDRM
jgi:hypothetical protein